MVEIVVHHAYVYASKASVLIFSACTKVISMSSKIANIF